MIEVKRLFRWRGWVVVHNSMDSAKLALIEELQRVGAVGDHPVRKSMIEYGSKNDYDVSSIYDEIDPFEYFHAVEPLEPVEMHVPAFEMEEDPKFPSPSVVRGLLSGLPQRHLQVGESFTIVFSAEAHQWAETMPLGWVHQWRDDP